MLVASSATITACSSAPTPASKRPALQEFDTTTVPAADRHDKYDPLVYCGGTGPYGCPQPTQKTVRAKPAPAPIEQPPSPVFASNAGAPTGAADMEAFSDVLFDFNKSVLTPTAQQDLRALSSVLKGRTLQLAGFTDSVGGEAYNDRLALARANAVRDFLVSRGLDAGAISTIGEGVCCYVASNSSDESRRLNRRVEIRLKRVSASEGAESSTLQPSNLNP